MATTYNCYALTGVGARVLADVVQVSIADKDRAFVVMNGEMVFFQYDSNSIAPHNVTTPPYSVRPNDFASAGVWVEQMPRLPALANGKIWLGTPSGMPTQTNNFGKLEDDVQPKLGGNLALNQKLVFLEKDIAVDEAAVGEASRVNIGENAQGFAAPLYIAPNQNYNTCNAGSAATMPCVALALEQGTGQRAVLLKGFIRKDSFNWVVGGTNGIIYIHTNTGVLTQTKPANPGERVQEIGVAVTDKIMYFNPQTAMIVV